MADVTTNHAIGNDRSQEGNVRYASVSATIAADQAANDVIRLLRVPSNAKVTKVSLGIGNSASAGAVNLGVYTFNEDGDGAVVDADLFGSAISITSGLSRTANQIDESGEISDAEASQPLWQAAGLSADAAPAYLVIAATVSTPFVAADTTLFAEVEYSL